MWKTKLSYAIYELKNGLLLDPKSHWDDGYSMFPSGYNTQEAALEEITKEPNAPQNLVIVAQVYKYWEVE